MTLAARSVTAVPASSNSSSGRELGCMVVNDRWQIVVTDAVPR